MNWMDTPHTLAPVDAGQGFWVFAYGSLIWKTGFEVAETVLGRLAGYHRSFCMSSVVYRGTPEAPGLVLALDRAEADTQCDGVAYWVDPKSAPETLSYLRDRELVSSAYVEELVELELVDNRTVQALAYVINRDHAQYCKGMDLAAQAEIIARASGSTGANSEYLFNTVHSLTSLGIDDPDLMELAEQVRRKL